MNFSKALELLKQGKKARRKEWGKSTKIFIRNEQLFVGNDEEECNYVNTSAYCILSDILADDWEEYKEPLLTKEEKEYLKALLKVYRNKQIEIENAKFDGNDKRRISDYASALGKEVVIDDIIYDITNYDKRWETKSDVDSLIKKMEEE